MTFCNNFSETSQEKLTKVTRANWALYNLNLI